MCGCELLEITTQQIILKHAHSKTNLIYFYIYMNKYNIKGNIMLSIYLFYLFHHLRNAISFICNEAHSALQFFLVGWEKNVQEKKHFKMFLLWYFDLNLENCHLKGLVSINSVQPPSVIGSRSIDVIHFPLTAIPKLNVR